VEKLIAFICSNVPFSTFALAVLIWILATLPQRKTITKQASVEILIKYLFLLPVGISGIWGFVFHAFFPDLSASYIGWKPSPFQFEVAVANLGIGVTGLIAFKASSGFRWATAISVVCFLWGAAGGHIYQMIKHHNFSPGNAGLIFYTDIFIPLTLIVLLALQRKWAK